MQYTFMIVFALVLLLTSGAMAAGADHPDVSARLRVQSLFQNDESWGKDATFAVARARLELFGDIDSKLTAKAAIEGRDKDDGLILIEGYAAYTVHPALEIRAGQMLVPFGLESRRGFDRRKFVDRSLVTDGLTRDLGRRPKDGRNGRFRDAGVQLSGRAPIEDFTIDYCAMLCNGNGILAVDNNDEKDIVARLTVASPWGLAAGGSVYFGTFENLVDSTGMDERAFGVELLWSGKIHDHDCRLQGEYIAAVWDTTGEDIKPRGFYLSAAVYAREDLELCGRYEEYEPNGNLAATIKRTRGSFALRYYLTGRSFVAADYEIREYDDDSAISNRLTVQVQAVF